MTWFVRLQGEYAYMFGKNAVAKWDQANQSIVFQGVSLPGNCMVPSGQTSSTCWLPDRFTVSFLLTNRRNVAAGQAIPSIEASTGTEEDMNLNLLFNRLQIGGPPLNTADQSPRFEAARIVQNSTIAGGYNNLSLSFTVTTNLLNNARAVSSIVISGLVGTQTQTSSSLPIYGADAQLFQGRSGIWQRSDGSLTLTVAPGAAVVAGYNVQLSIVIINPEQQQAAARPTITAIVTYKYAAQKFGPSEDELEDVSQVDSLARAPPLLLPQLPVQGSGLLTGATKSGFTTKIIHESTQVNFASNLLTVTLESNIVLPAGAVIELTGFRTATAFGSGRLSLRGPKAAFVVDMKAGFQKDYTDVYTISMELISDLNAYEQFVVQFVLQNPSCSDICPGNTIMIRAQGKGPVVGVAGPYISFAGLFRTRVIARTWHKHSNKCMRLHYLPAHATCENNV